MNQELARCGLNAIDGDDAPVLAGVHAAGRLDGVLFDLQIRQTYRNAGTKVLEVVYTFPLPHGAVLLGFASVLNGERSVGTVVARPDAEQTYEEALAVGDAPVLLERAADGLCTANIGNLKPGDEIVLELRYAQLLTFDQGRLRVAIPTTVAPRYGRPADGGLQPQQVPLTSLMAHQPLTLSLEIAGSLATSEVETPTHRFRRSTEGRVLKLELEGEAALDRDVVVVLKPAESLPSLVVQAADPNGGDAPRIVMAALLPATPGERAGIALKLLVDCSGSMAGDSIASARRALRGVVAGLHERDSVSLSRFGSTVDHAFPVARVGPQMLVSLAERVDRVDSDLGGTEMHAALQATFGLGTPAGFDGAEVLLITDGEVWNTAPIIEACRASRHRIFALGVGSSPADGVLRSLAAASGGACEFATPGENLEAAARRMLDRMRKAPHRAPRIDWGAEPVWQTPLPASVCGGDTVIAFAGLRSGIATSAVRLLARDAAGTEVEVARGEAEALMSGDTLPRMAAARRIVDADEATALRLALDHQLIGGQTCCVLVHARADKAIDPAELHRVQSMLPAGWGGVGAVSSSVAAPLLGPAPPRGPARPVAARSLGTKEFEPPAFLRRQVVEPASGSLWSFARAVDDHLELNDSPKGLALRCGSMPMRGELARAIEAVVATGLDADLAWLLLSYWVEHPGTSARGDAVAVDLQPYLDAVDPDLVARALRLLDRHLGRFDRSDWSTSRGRRLGRAMGRE